MTRMGLHMNTLKGAEQVIDYCRRVQPAVMKSLAPDRELIAACREVSPQTIWIGRVEWSDQSLGTYKDFQKLTLSRAHELRDAVQFFEGFNEFSTDVGILRKFAKAEVGLAKRLADMGMGACIGGFGTMFVESDEAFDRWRPALEYMAEHADQCLWHFHEYSAPYVQFGAQTPDGANLFKEDSGEFTGFCATREAYFQPGLLGWLTLRYRMIRPRLEREGLGAIRMVITESGIDGGVTRRPGPVGGGYRDFAGQEWAREPAVGDYAEQLQWYWWHISHDPYVVGGVDFGWGTADPHWGSWDLSLDPPMLARVIELQSALPVGPVVGAPLPPPLVVTEPPPTTIPTPATPPVATPMARDLWPATSASGDDTWTALARDLLGREASEAEVAALVAANGGAATPQEVGSVRSPWHEVIPKAEG